MIRGAGVTAVAIAVGFAIAALLSLTAHGASRVPIESTVRDVRVGDVGPPGPSVGDTRSEILFLWNRDIAAVPIGTAYLLCTTLGEGGVYGRRAAAWCSGSYNLPRGKLYVAGVRRATRFYGLSVVAGTRLYRGATGHVTVRPSGLRFLETTFALD